jgi:hypothetical protein
MRKTLQKCNRSEVKTLSRASVYIGRTSNGQTESDLSGDCYRTCNIGSGSEAAWMVKKDRGPVVDTKMSCNNHLVRDQTE